MNEEKTIVPSVYLAEKDEAYEYRILVPGIGKGDADLHMENRTMTLRTHASFQKPAGFKAVAEEFEHVNYAVSIDLPEMADPESLSAKLENGVLVVTVQKRPETKSRRIDVL